MIFLKEFDVIVVGAGPAGLMASKLLAQKNLSVLCIDKKQEIGVPKQCGEGLSSKYFKLLGLKEGDEYCSQEIYGASLYAPSEKRVDIRFNKISGYILERRIFEKVLARDAANAGAKIQVMSPLVDARRENGKVIVKCGGLFNEEYICKIIIGADGPQSFTASKLGMNVKLDSYDIDSGFQYEMAGLNFKKMGIDKEMLHIFFGTKISPRGYVWIFAKKNNTANVGVGIGANEKGSAKEYLDKWISSHKEWFENASIIEVNSGTIPVGGLLEDLVDDNLVVIGDAARQVNPIHGGGIGTALEASLLASQVIEKAFKKNDFSKKLLDEYTRKWYEMRGNQFKKLVKVRHMLEKFTDDDFELMAKSINGEDVMKISHGDLISSAKIVSTKLIKNPGLVALMLKYLKS